MAELRLACRLLRKQPIVTLTTLFALTDTFRFPNSGEVWLPIVESGAASANALTSARTFGVLRDGSDPAAANSQVAALSKQVETDNAAAPRLRVVVRRFTDALSQGLELMTVVLVTCLVLVLLVIAANIANLVLARTVSQSRELAVRTPLGATRRRLRLPAGSGLWGLVLLGIMMIARRVVVRVGSCTPRAGHRTRRCSSSRIERSWLSLLPAISISGSAVKTSSKER